MGLSPEQYNLNFSEVEKSHNDSEDNRNLSEEDKAMLERIKARMRKELAYKNLPPNDPAFDIVGKIRLEQDKAGMQPTKRREMD